MIQQIDFARCFECMRYVVLDKNHDCPMCGVHCEKTVSGLHQKNANLFLALREILDQLEAQIVEGEE